MLNRLNTLRSRRTLGAFSLVEILIVILIISVLMAVAIPNLLSSRDSGTDSAAKQLLARAQTEIGGYTFKTETSPENVETAAANSIDKLVPSINFVASTASAEKVAGTNARQVSYAKGTNPGDFKITARGSKTNCWGLYVTSTGTTFIGLASTASCAAGSVSFAGTGANTNKFAFPSDAS